MEQNNTTKKKTRRHEDIPYCFASNEAAASATAKVRDKYDGKISAYSIGKILYVQAHASHLMNFDIRAFIRSIGGVEA